MTIRANSKSMDFLLFATNAHRGYGRRFTEESPGGRKRYQGPRRKSGRTALAILARVPTIPMPEHPTSPSHPSDRATAAYLAYYELLRFIAGQKFHVPAAEVDNVVHEVFVAYLRHVQTIRDDRSWLVAAVCNASRAYWRGTERRTGLLEAEIERSNSLSIGEAATATLEAKALLARLPERCREWLRLRFCDGYSPKELAARYHTTVGYAKLRLHRCMTRARALICGARS